MIFKLYGLNHNVDFNGTPSVDGIDVIIHDESTFYKVIKFELNYQTTYYLEIEDTYLIEDEDEEVLYTYSRVLNDKKHTVLFNLKHTGHLEWEMLPVEKVTL